MRTNVASAVGIGFGIGLGLAVGGALVSVASVAPALAGQSTPAPPAPTFAPPTPSFRPAVSGAGIPEKVLRYTRRVAFSATAGGVSAQEAWCDQPADAIVTGSCTAPSNSVAQLTSTDILYPTDTSWKTAYRCAFVNNGRNSVQVEAQIVCQRPR